MDDATATWLTPAAPAAIAVVRVPALAALCDRTLPVPGRARCVHLLHASGAVVDEAVALGRSDGGLELMVHGGAGVRAAVGAALESHGLAVQPAPSPGGTEYWAALARAAHPAAVRWLLAHPHDPPPFPAAYLARQPLVLISGPANAGKSTLLNAWCGHERALVDERPGTTRDLVAASTLVAGWRLRLVDSAGLRPTSNRLEAAGQELAGRMRQHADLVLHLATPEEGGTGAEAGDLVVQGKADLAGQRPPQALCWSCHGLPGRNAARLLDALGRAVLARLGLPEAGCGPEATAAG